MATKLRSDLQFASQAVADAYYVLSDKTRRREYDALYSARSTSEKTDAPDASSNFFANFANMFAGGATTGGTGVPPTGENQPNAEATFADVFEDVCAATHIL